MKFLLRLIGLLLMLLAFDAASYANAFIIPEELPSILSLVYSNIPPIKKGTDSRLGFGFRLGEHADFQVQFEIGPQQRTRPIGSASGSSKRNVDSDDYQNYKKQSSSNSKNPGRTWLETWSKEAKQKQQFNKDKHRDAIQQSNAPSSSPSSPTLSAAVPTGMPATPIIDHAVLSQLQQLYDMNKTNAPKDEGTLPAASQLDERLAQKRSELVAFRAMPAENEVEPQQHALPSFKPLPGTGVRNVRRRTTTTTASQKDKISADLADVSLD